jgi:hypothetical protein
VIVVVLVLVVAATLPLFGVRRALVDPLRPAVELTALDQSWGMFAPNPRTNQLSLRVVLSYPDGSTWTWTPPIGGPWISPASDYRWGKWMENTAAAFDPLARQTAFYAARVAPRAGATRAEVIVRRTMLPGVPAPAVEDWRLQRATFDLGGRS